MSTWTTSTSTGCMFMVYDRRTAERYGGRYPIPPVGAVADHVVSGYGAAGLTDALTRRLATNWRSEMPVGIAPGRAGSRFRRPPGRHGRPLQRHGCSGASTTSSGAAPRRWSSPSTGPRRGTTASQTSTVTHRRRRAAATPSALVGTTFDTDSGPRIGTQGQILGTTGSHPRVSTARATASTGSSVRVIRAGDPPSGPGWSSASSPGPHAGAPVPPGHG